MTPITTPDEAQAILPVTPEDKWQAAWDALPDGMHAYERARQAGINALGQSHSLPGGREAVASALHKKACGLLPANTIGPIEDERSFWLSLADAALTPSALSPEPVQKLHELPEGHRWCRHCEQKDPHCSVCEGVGYLPSALSVPVGDDLAKGLRTSQKALDEIARQEQANIAGYLALRDFPVGSASGHFPPDEVGPNALGSDIPSIAAQLLEISRISNKYDLRECIEGHDDALGDSYIWRDLMDQCEKLGTNPSALSGDAGEVGLRQLIAKRQQEEQAEYKARYAEGRPWQARRYAAEVLRRLLIDHQTETERASA